MYFLALINAKGKQKFPTVCLRCITKEEIVMEGLSVS